ncbi:MAG: FHA domain-containing protein [Sandaracinaceae bacterium]
MVSCKNCGAQNPESSLYCQDCGSRLGDWEPAEGPQRMATPPTGLSRSRDGSPSTSVQPHCPRCGLPNAPHMRFCNNCGYQMDPSASAPPASAPGGRASGGSVPPASASGEGPVCWRCFGVGDAGADFCKFCGARYADAPAGSGSSPAAPGPVPSAPSAAAAVPATSSPAAASYGGGSVPAAPFEARHAAAVSRPTADEGGLRTDRPVRARLIAILKDGTDGRAYPIHDETTDIGRHEGQVALAEDPYLSSRHARLVFRGGRAWLRDLDSVNGIYLRIREPVDLADGDMLLLGQQVLRFELLAEAELPLGPATQHGVMVFGTPEVQRIARLVQYTTEGVGRDVHYLYRDETVIGREQGDLVFTDDPFMSRRHAAVSVDRANRRFVLRDLGSSNGTAIRFRGERGLRHGDQFRVGRHLFRFEEGSAGGPNGR